MERLYLKDGYIDFSGKEMKSYHEYYVSLAEILPYTIGQIETAGFPERFDTIVKNIIPNKATRMTLLYFLSLIPSCNKKRKYSALFLGKAGTGKTVVCNIIRKIFSGATGILPIDSFYNPFPAAVYSQLEGKSAAILDGMNYKKRVNSALYKNITSGDTIAYKPLWQKDVKQFAPTAQVILTSNYGVKFDTDDLAIKKRLLVIPFNTCFIDHPGAVTAEAIDTVISREGASIIRYLVELYIFLRDDLHGEIPVSDECKIASEQMWGGR